MADWGSVTSGVLVGITVLSALVAWTVGPAVVVGGRYDRRLANRRHLLRPRVPPNPGLSLLAVTGLVYLNQLLFTVYVIRVHGGDPSFVARFLPAGWFDLATGSPLLRALAEIFPAPELLAPTVLRVQAFLELPFVLLGYLTVCRWLDPALYLRMARSPLIWLASASYTLTFCVIEWTLRNPYTFDDIWLRLTSALVAPAWIAWMARSEPGRDQAGFRSPSPPALLAFTASGWALGFLVLAVYDTALLYNLGHLGPRLPGIALTLAVLAAARLAAQLLERRGSPVPQSSSIVSDTVASAMRWFLALFFVVALPVRYAATEPAAQAVGAITILAAAAASGLGVLRRVRPQDPHTSRPPPRAITAWTVKMSVAVLVGIAVALAVVWRVQDIYPETVLLHAVSAFLACTIAAGGLLDRVRLTGRRGRSGVI
ncbi:MAG: hypothetical protein GEV03_28285 [Streptosporangiales bacterium]|nr:hypothetical protein [Streptosporangiales bacterium]